MYYIKYQFHTYHVACGGLLNWASCNYVTNALTGYLRCCNTIFLDMLTITAREMDSLIKVNIPLK